MKSEVGKAYRGSDGVVRWITGKTRWGYYNLHQDESTGIWYAGGYIQHKHWDPIAHAAGGEILAPQPGDCYLRCGPMGTVSEQVVREQNE